MANKLVQNLPADKRDGSTVLSGILRDMTQDGSKSSAVALSLLARLESAPAVAERLKSEPEKVVADLEELRKACTVYTLGHVAFGAETSCSNGPERHSNSSRW